MFQTHFLTSDASDVLRGGKPPAEKIMTDGCGLMNAAALIRIAQRLGLPSRPSAVQGRVAGSKGLWILHPDYLDPTDVPRIWIRDSQKKIQLDLEHGGRAHLIFDHVATPRLSTPGHLSKQTIMNLSHNHVPDEVIQDLMQKGLEDEVRPLMQWTGPEAMRLLWSVVNKAGGVSGERLRKLAGAASRALGLNSSREIEEGFVDEDADEESFENAASDNSEDEPYTSLHQNVLYLLQAGFRPEQSAHLWGKLKRVVTMAIDSYIKKYRITVPQSAEAFIVPGTSLFTDTRRCTDLLQ